jgi:HNH endonuclease
VAKAKPHAPLVYYIRRGDLIKIGTSAQLRCRLSQQVYDELLAVEPGSYDLEDERHRQFAAVQVPKRPGQNEWFRAAEALLTHTDALRALHGLPDLSTRDCPRLGPAEQALLAALPPLLIPVRPGTLARFVTKIAVDRQSGCWRRSASLDKKGYADFNLNGRQIPAHRASHTMFVGPIPGGYQVDHVKARGCRWRDCVWPGHLEAVTGRENTLRSGNKGGINARVTHCPADHEYTPENTYRVGPNKDRRQCKTCTREQGAARYERRKAAKASKAAAPRIADVIALLPAPCHPLPPGTLQRFAARIIIDPDTGCYRRPTRVSGEGAGTFWLEGRTRSGRTAAHLMFIGPVPAGSFVRHVDGHGPFHEDCVRPSHLEAAAAGNRTISAIRSAQQRAKTHCPQRHELTGDNVYWRKGGRRQCKICTRQRAAARYWQNRTPKRAAAGGVTDGTPERQDSFLPGLGPEDTAAASYC